MIFVKRILPIFTLILFAISAWGQDGLKSPDQFLPHKLGDKFTPYHLLIDYFEHVANHSDQVVLDIYGRTNQDRPLIYTVISSKENINRLEQIRKSNLAMTGLIDGNIEKLEKSIAVVWLSFGVHGNEAGASESSIQTLYELADPTNKTTQAWLQNTVVILDPCINPDGYSRYTHWNRGVGNKIPNANSISREHAEPWPGGRVNHYLFDLNRDWAWQTQVESSQRMKIYQQWMPHVHVDFHEQGYNSPYYFAPAAAPFHQYVTPWQATFQIDVGLNNAKYFDKKGWLYFTGEEFDLFYPSYGDTYPIFNGAIGMTYEQAGHSRAGLAIVMENGDTLKLIDRINHHKTTALSTVEVCAKNAKELSENFNAYFQKSLKNPVGEYKTFVIGASNPIDKIESLCDLLDKNNIQYNRLEKASSATGFDYVSREEKNVKLGEGDLVISAFQPMSVLTQVLFEPKSYLVDSVTYDITAWSLPYAFGLDAFALKQKIKAEGKFDFVKNNINITNSTKPYAYLFNWESLADAKFLAALQKENIKVRYSSEAFELEGISYKAGTIVITRADNKWLGNRLHKILENKAKKFKQDLRTVSTGFTSKGHDLGSGKMHLLQKPKVLVIGGKGISPYNFGQVWHYFETDLAYDLSIISPDDLTNVDLRDFNLLIMPEGRYGLNSSDLDELKDWIRGGGRVIAIGQALSTFDGVSGFTLEKFAKSSDGDKERRIKEKEALENRLDTYDGQERRSISGSIPGAIYKLKIDNTHPLGFGMPNHYFSLKTSSRNYKFLKNTWNVGTIGEKPEVIGFVGSKLKNKMKETTVFGVQHMGRGSITYMVDNPLYRGFWEQGKFLFSNAVFFVGQ